MRVPNLDSWDARIFGRYWAGFEPPRHTYIFSIESLRRYLDRAGFTKISMACNIGSYPTFVLSVRFWLTGRNVPPHRRERIIAALHHPLMRLISAPFFFLANSGLRGPLVIAAARKAPKQPGL